MKFVIENCKDSTIKLSLSEVCGDVYLMAESNGESSSILKIDGSSGWIQMSKVTDDFFSKLGFHCNHGQVHDKKLIGGPDFESVFVMDHTMNHDINLCKG